MATTKVRGELVDLNESTSESGLKMPSGTELNRPTAAAGQIRNNTNETSDGSASCEEYYNGTAWQKINNVALPVYYRAVTYSGNSGTQSITGFGFQPDLIWIKRTNSAEPHALYDSTRGINKQLEPNSSAAEATNTAPYEGVNSFDADGFTTGDNGGTNRSPNDYVAWAWAANGGTTSTNTDGTNTSQVQVNSNSGLSIVSGTASGGYPTFNSFGHGLGTTPGLIIVKQTTGLVAGWAIWHKDYANTSQDFMNFNTTTGVTSSQYVWGNQAPTSSVFSITDGWTVNVGAPFIAYCFAEVAGFSSFGSYTGNATAGQAITTGFQPTFILIKSTVGNANWRLYDTVRGITAGGFIRVQGTNAQDTSDAPNLDITATGFEINANGVSQGLNANGNLYIYIAFK